LPLADEQFAREDLQSLTLKRYARGVAAVILVSVAANMADTSPGLQTARLCSEFRSGNTTKQAATELADLVVTKFIGFSGLTSAESAI
jgi:hypothetical protein